MFRVILEVDGLDAFTAKYLFQNNKSVKITLKNPISPNAAQRTLKWIRGDKIETIRLKRITHLGQIFEMFELKNPFVVEYDYIEEDVKILVGFDKGTYV